MATTLKPIPVKAIGGHYVDPQKRMGYSQPVADSNAGTYVQPVTTELNPDANQFLTLITEYFNLTGAYPPGMDLSTYSPTDYAKTLTPEQLKASSTTIYNSLNNGDMKRNATDAQQVMTNITEGKDINYKPPVDVIPGVVPVVEPKTDPTTPTPAKDWNVDFNAFKKANPATTLTYKDFALAQKGYELAGFKPDEAGSFALQDMGTYAVKEAKDVANEAAITAKVANLPGEIQTQYTKLNDALAAFSNKNLTEKVNPAIMQSLNARGILDSGALNTALAGASNDAETARLAQIAPLVSEATVGGLKEQYADLLRKSQASGVELSNPGAFMNTFYTPAYNTAQQGVQNAFTSNQNSLNRSLQTALANKGITANAATNKANQDWQTSLFNQQNEAQSQKNQGGLAAQLISILGGAGMGALGGFGTGGWAGAGMGALAGLTGKYPTSY